MMKVLVVDDEPMARAATTHALKRAGYDVLTAHHGVEALAILERGGCQLVVSDWEMPVMDGLELCHQIRSGQFAGYIYTILLTSNGSPENAVNGLAAGADDYIVKPFHPAELVMRVNSGRRIVGVETRDMTIFALARLAESRDSDTGSHLERVRSYSRCLAEELRRRNTFPDQIDDQFVQLIYETSPLHDIGKVAIPDAVLLKPGRLNDSEMAIMRHHTYEGAKTLDAALKKFPGAMFLQMARDIAISHHEKYDGTGYPEGLAKDAIPLCGRIVAVADVYDALTSRRVYKEAMSHEDAKAIIIRDSGRHFDPRVVEAFVAVEPSILSIRDQHSEDENVEDNQSDIPVAAAM